MLGLFGVVIILNILLFIMSFMCKTGKCGEFVQAKLSQFKFNAYIRFYMLSYFDFTFLSILKILDGKNLTTIRKVARFFSYAFFVLSIILPTFFLALLIKRAPILNEKEGKAKFNTLITKIDKRSKWRLFQPIMFFIRRASTAALLCMPIDNEYIFLQYIFILVTSHIYILYLVGTEPYQTPIYNGYMVANETFYSMIIILIFIFSDATPQLNLKVIAGLALVVSIFLIVGANLVLVLYLVIKGRESLKEAVKLALKKRIEEEEKEAEDERERQEKKRLEQEEMYRLPDDSTTANETANANTSVSHGSNTTLSDLKGMKKTGPVWDSKNAKTKGKDLD
jgi:hypothetical protein